MSIYEFLLTARDYIVDFVGAYMHYVGGSNSESNSNSDSDVHSYASDDLCDEFYLPSVEPAWPYRPPTPNPLASAEFHRDYEGPYNSLKR